MATWSDFLPDVLPHVNGCSIDLAEHEVKRAAQEFFRRTFAWRIDLDPIAVAADTETVTLTMPSSPDVKLVRVETVIYDDTRLAPTTRETLHNDYSDNWQDHTGEPDAWFSDEPAILRLYPIPTAAATTGLQVNVSVIPDDTATGIPDNLYNKFNEAIYLGARARLMMYPPPAVFHQPQLAAMYAQAYQKQIDKFTLDKARGFTNARIPSRPRWC